MGDWSVGGLWSNEKMQLTLLIMQAIIILKKSGWLRAPLFSPCHKPHMSPPLNTPAPKSHMGVSYTMPAIVHTQQTRTAKENTITCGSAMSTRQGWKKKAQQPTSLSQKKSTLQNILNCMGKIEGQLHPFSKIVLTSHNFTKWRTMHSKHNFKLPTSQNLLHLVAERQFRLTMIIMKKLLSMKQRQG